MHILEFIALFDDKVKERLNKRAKTEKYISLIKEQILITRLPHTPVRPIYKTLKKNGCDFTYQYFMKIVEENWNTVNEGGRCCLIVSSERDKLCHW